MNKLTAERFEHNFDLKFDQKFDHFDACAGESDVKDSKELDVESENNDLNSASTRSEDFEEYKGFEKNEKFNFSYARTENADRGYEGVGGCYFNSAYPEYLVPRTFCRESNEDVPCDLSNWHRGLKFDQSVSNPEGNTSASVESDRDVNADNVGQTDPNVGQTDSNVGQTDLTGVDQGDQPINFAYYHF